MQSLVYRFTSHALYIYIYIFVYVFVYVLMSCKTRGEMIQGQKKTDWHGIPVYVMVFTATIPRAELNSTLCSSDARLHRVRLLACLPEITYNTLLVKERKKEVFYLTTHPTHFIFRLYGVRHMVKYHSDSERKPTALSEYAPSHRQDSTYHGLCYTSRGALAGTSLFNDALNIFYFSDIWRRTYGKIPPR